MSAIGPIGNLPLSAPHMPVEGAVPTPKAESSAIPFADFFSDAVASANLHNMNAGKAAEAFAAGARDDIHGTMIAVKEAEIELKLVSNVRNKLVEAFQDLWRLNI
ncbi:MAG TPA: flagellar hook-basal body complex protein FliE [Polyangiaceae bacterium]|nr:flagellar hook-basal body complex protein FliE [Polyangiaceae bacterium]